MLKTLYKNHLIIIYDIDMNFIHLQIFFHLNILREILSNVEKNGCTLKFKLLSFMCCILKL